MMATGFAFAENVAYEQLKDAAINAPTVPLDKSAADSSKKITKAAPEATEPAEVKKEPWGIKGMTFKKEEKKPLNIGKAITDTIGEYKQEIVFGGIGAILGFLMVGTAAGALTGGFIFLAFLLIM